MDLGTIRWDIEVGTDQLDEARRRMDEMRRSMGDVRTDLDRNRRATEQFNSSLRSLANLAASAAAAFAGFVGVKRFLDVINATEALKRGFTAVTGSATAAAREMEYAATVADRLGQSAVDTSQAYLSLTAATKGTALAGEETRQIFEAVGTAMATLGKSSAETRGALVAVEQMISKGTVSAEELRGQLGERIPGAFQAAARSIGATTQELQKMLEQGELTAERLLPALTEELNRLYDTGERVATLSAEWSRLGNAFGALYEQINQTYGVTDTLAGAVRTLTDWVNALNVAVGSGAIDGWLTGLQAAAGAAGSAVVAYASLTAAINLAAVAQAALNAVMRVNPFVATATAIVGVAGALYAVRDASIEVEGQTARVGDLVVRAWTVAADNVSSAWSAATANMNADTAAMAGGSAAAASAIFDAFADSFIKTVEFAERSINAMLTAFVGLGRSAGQVAAALVMSFRHAFDSISTIAGAFWQDLVGGNWSFSGVGGAISSAWAGEVAIMEGLTSDLKDNFSGLKDYTGNFAEAMRGYLQQVTDEAAFDTAFAEQNRLTEEHNRALRELKRTQVQVTESTSDLAEALGASGGSGGTSGKSQAGATKAAAAAAKEAEQELSRLETVTEGLIRRYLPARAATEEYAEAQLALAHAVSQGRISQEEATKALEGLRSAHEKAAAEAEDAADTWQTAWERAVERIDDAFQSLWQGLLSGQSSFAATLRSLLANLGAELLHGAITRPISQALTGALTGAVSSAASAGAGNSAGGIGLGNLASLGNLFGGTGIGNMLAGGLNAINYGLIGNRIGEGILSTTAANISILPNWAFGAGAIGGGLLGSLLFDGKEAQIGSTIGSSAGTAMGASFAAALGVTGPIGAIAGGLLGGLGGGLLGSLFGDDEPRIGAFSASLRGTHGLEDAVGARGGFGLTFGLSDAGSANFDASELREAFDALAEVSQILADFLGADVEAQVQESLSAAADANWSRDGVMRLAGDLDAAFRTIFEDIAKHAAATGDDLAVIFAGVLGPLSGSAEQMANQIQAAMQRTVAAVQGATAIYAAGLTEQLNLSGQLAQDAQAVLGYADMLTQAGESAAVGLERLITNSAALTQAAELTGTELTATGEQFVLLGQALTEAAGGAQALMEQQALYYQHFFSEEERAARTRDAALAQVRQWIESQGLANSAADSAARALLDQVNAIDATSGSAQAAMAALRAYVESLDLNTEAGAQAHASAMQLVTVLLSLDGALSTLGESAAQASAAAEAAAQDAANQSSETPGARRAPGGGGGGGGGTSGAIGTARERVRYLEYRLQVLERRGEESSKLYERLAGELDHLNGVLAATSDSTSSAVQSGEDLARQRADLELQILELTDSEAALAERRRRVLAELDPTLHEMQRQVWLLEEQRDAAQKLAEAQERLIEQQSELELQLLRLTDPAAALALERERELAALPESLRALQQRVWQLQEEQAAAEAAAEAARNLQEQQQELELQLLELTDPLAAVAERRRRELEQLDPSLHALQQRIYSLQDEQAAAEAAAEAERELASAREGYEQRMAELQLELIELREGASARRTAEMRRELAANDASLHAIIRRIYGLQEQVEAERAATQSTEDYASAVRSTIDTIDSALREIRGLMLTPQQSLAEAMAIVRDPTSQPGDALNAAISRLTRIDPENYSTPEEYDRALMSAENALEALRDRLSEQESYQDQMLEAADLQLEEQAKTTMAVVDLQLVFGRWVRGVERRLSETEASTGVTKKIPAYALGGAHPGGWAMVGERGPELIRTGGPAQVYSHHETQTVLGYTEMKKELEQLRDSINEANRYIARQTYRSAETLEKLDQRGILTREE